MDKILSLLGLSYRAGKLLLGENVLDNMKEVKLLILAADASEKTKERYAKKCAFYHIGCIDRYDSEALSKALGKRGIKAAGLTDEGFRDAILKEL